MADIKNPQRQQSADVKSPEFFNYSKLLLDGDIESNPGPSNTPCKGRPKKVGFKGTPKKLKVGRSKNISGEFGESSLKRPIDFGNPHATPLGLRNEGENVCFFNSVIQMLHSIPTFRNEVLFSESSDEVVSAVRNIFRDFSISETPLKSSQYLQQIRLRDYVFGMQ